jgi:heme exporter protein D
MNHFKKTELIILIILWVSSLTTYSIALLNNYILYTSDYLGLIGLTIVSIISFLKPEKALGSVMILLILGTFNLLSFVYFFNIVMTFGFSILVTPGIQLISLVLLTVLTIKKRKKVTELYRKTFGQTKEEREQTKLSAKNRFKSRFEKLTDKEIDSKLEQDLVSEAIEALNEIKKERKTPYNNGEHAGPLQAITRCQAPHASRDVVCNMLKYEDCNPNSFTNIPV